MRTKDPDSVYSRIADRLRDELATRKRGVGDRLPSVREMARQFGCSIATIQNAMTLLRREGVLESRRQEGTFVRSLPASGQNRGRVICLFPKWDFVERKAFASEYALGVTLAASEQGYAVESLPGATLNDPQSVLARLHRDRYAGVLWADPAEHDILAQLEGCGIRVVTSIRHFPAHNLPRTVDDYATAYAQAAGLVFAHGVRRMGLLCNGTDDPTYEPALQELLRALTKAGIQVPSDLVNRARCGGLDGDSRTVLLRHFLAQRDRWDGCWAFAPDILEDLRDIVRKDRIDLGNRFLAVQTIRAVPVHDAHLVLESDPHAHGREAFRLLHEWIETGHRPTETRVPMVCRGS